MVISVAYSYYCALTEINLAASVLLIFFALGFASQATYKLPYVISGVCWGCSLVYVSFWVKINIIQFYSFYCILLYISLLTFSLLL